VAVSGALGSGAFTGFTAGAFAATGFVAGVGVGVGAFLAGFGVGADFLAGAAGRWTATGIAALGADFLACFLDIQKGSRRVTTGRPHLSQQLWVTMTEGSRTRKKEDGLPDHYDGISVA
jgi:hypothetical protein